MNLEEAIATVLTYVVKLAHRLWCPTFKDMSRLGKLSDLFELW